MQHLAPLLLPRPQKMKLTGGKVEIVVNPLVVNGFDSDKVRNIFQRNSQIENSKTEHEDRNFSSRSPLCPPLLRGELMGGSSNISSYVQKKCGIVIAESGSSPQIKCSVTNDLSGGIEAYRLVIKQPMNANNPPITITGNSEIGLINGLKTVMQLITQYGGSLPALEIEDYPDFVNRSVMLDVSRDRVPTMEQLFQTVDSLSSLKINHLQLYTEHTFAYQGHEIVWKDASPLTPLEIRRLDSYCSDRSIALAANQNCFGHLTRWLKHPEYSHLAETSGEWYFGGMKRSEPFSLCPADEGSAKLVKDLLGQLLPNFSHRVVNIGCDETFDVGQGRSKQACDKSGKGKILTEYVNKIVTQAHNLGYRPQIWADMALNHPEAIDELDKEATLLIWGYEPDSPYERWCRKVFQTGREFWVCPGTSSWRSITGRSFERKMNLHRAAVMGRNYGANGFMVTDWGDLGHRQQWPISLHGIAEAANAAWNVDSVLAYDSKATSLQVFKDNTGNVGLWLNKFGDVDLELREVSGHTDAYGYPTPLKNSTAIFNDLHVPLGVEGKGTVMDWESVESNLADLAACVPGSVTNQIHDEIRHSLEVAIFAVKRAIIRRKSFNIPEKTRKDLHRKLTELIEEHRRLWFLRSRLGGLEDSCGYYYNVLSELEK